MYQFSQKTWLSAKSSIQISFLPILLKEVTHSEQIDVSPLGDFANAAKQLIDIIYIALSRSLIERHQRSLQQSLCDLATLQIADENSRQVNPILRPYTKGSHLLPIQYFLRLMDVFFLFTDGLLLIATDVCLNAYTCLLMIDLLVFKMSFHVRIGIWTLPSEWWDDKGIDWMSLRLLSIITNDKWLILCLPHFQVIANLMPNHSASNHINLYILRSFALFSSFLIDDPHQNNVFSISLPNTIFRKFHQNLCSRRLPKAYLSAFAIMRIFDGLIQQFIR